MAHITAFSKPSTYASGVRARMPDRASPSYKPGTEAVTHLVEAAQRIRESLVLPASISDDVLMRSLEQIATGCDRRERWRAAFGSDLGRELADAGSDLNTALNAVLSLLPKPRD